MKFNLNEFYFFFCWQCSIYMNYCGGKSVVIFSITFFKCLCQCRIFLSGNAVKANANASFSFDFCKRVGFRFTFVHIKQLRN